MDKAPSSDSLDNVCRDDNICSSSGSSSATDFTSDDENDLYADYPLKNNLPFIAHERSVGALSRGDFIWSQVGDKCDPISRRIGGNYPLKSNQRMNWPQSSRGSREFHSTSHSTDPHNSHCSNGSSKKSNLFDRQIEILRQENEYLIDEDVNYTGSPIQKAEELGLSFSPNDNIDFERGHETSARYPKFNFDPLSDGLMNRLNVNTIAIRMCSRLVECRDLIEAVEFIEHNGIILDDMTRIITREAPAFRNYDMSNYQIDYSVKESFNPNFWLDREPVVTTADGNCQYHAVSLSLTGSELYTPEVRLATAVAVIRNREYFDSMLKLVDGGTVLDLVHTIGRSYSWGDETTLKAIAVAINRRIFLYTCNTGKKDYELVKSLKKDELIDAFKEKKYRGGTGIHTYADPLVQVPADDYIMLFHKSEHFIAVLPTSQNPVMFEPYNPIVPVFN